MRLDDRSTARPLDALLAENGSPAPTPQGWAIHPVGELLRRAFVGSGIASQVGPE